MKLFSVALLAGSALASVIPAGFQIQNTGEQLQQFLSDAASSSRQQIPELNVEDHLNIEKVKATLESAYSRVREQVEATAERVPSAIWGPPSEINLEKYTILQILNWTLHHGGHHHEDAADEHRHTLPIHRLAWAVNASKEAQDYLSGKDLTLLAPTDEALTPPHRRHENKEAEIDAEMKSFESLDSDVMSESIEHPFHTREFAHALKSHHHDYDDEDDEEREHRRKIFEKVIGYVIGYHTLPKQQTAQQIIEQSTLATSLNSSRIKVETTLGGFPPRPSVKFNLYSKVVGPTIKAKNGIIHLVSAPLLPPLSPLNQLFLFPQGFSTLTSDIQKVKMAVPLLPHGHHQREHETENFMNELIDELVYEHNLTSYTIFAPTNFAFARLGAKVVALLHSPFPISVKSLKYILAYHVVPDVTFFSDFVIGAKPIKEHDSAKFIVKQEINVNLPAAWLATESERTAFNWMESVDAADNENSGNVTHYELPTLLSESGVNKNATLKVAVVEYRFLGKGPLRRSVVVLPHHDHHEHEDDHHHHHGPPPAKPVTVFKADNPARKGAIHVVTSILQPPFPRCDKHETNSTADRHANKFSRSVAKVFA